MNQKHKRRINNHEFILRSRSDAWYDKAKRKSQTGERKWRSKAFQTECAPSTSSLGARPVWTTPDRRGEARKSLGKKRGYINLRDIAWLASTLQPNSDNLTPSLREQSEVIRHKSRQTPSSEPLLTCTRLKFWKRQFPPLRALLYQSSHLLLLSVWLSTGFFQESTVQVSPTKNRQNPPSMLMAFPPFSHRQASEG